MSDKSDEKANAAAEKAAEKATKAAAEQAAKEAAEKAAKEAAEQAAKDAAEKAAKEAAEQSAKDAAEKAENEAKKESKDKADKEVSDKAEHEAKEHADNGKSNNDDDKHDGRGHGDGDHNDDGHADNGKGSVTQAEKKAAAKAAADAAAKAAAEQAAADAAAKAAAEKAEHEAKEHADNGKSNNDDDKHDGRGHGDGDHNDDGHADNGKGPGDHGHHDDDHDHADNGNGGGDTKPAEAIVLTASDASENVAQAEQVGTGQTDDLAGVTGHDALYGKGGADTLVASNERLSVLKMPIDASLTDAADASAVSVVVSGMPKGATLSAGHDNGDGSWTLSVAELKDLTISTDSTTDFSLKVTAAATDGSGLTSSMDVTVHVGDAPSNLLVGGGGDDVITGSAQGNDYIYGGSIPTGVSDPAHVSTVADNDVIKAGDGNNHIWGNSGDDQITAGNGDNWISGGKGNDVITVGSGDNELYGNTGDDRVVVGGGNNVVHGGEGFDTLDFSLASGGVTVDAEKKTATGFGTVTFDGFEKFVGSNGDDTFLAGKKGEVFTGGEGNDTFVFDRTDIVSKGVALAAHEITDFGAGDTLDLRGVFAGHNWQGLDKMVQLVEDDKGTHVYAKVSQQMVEVTVLDNFHGHTVAEMVKDGSLLV